jgi:hypothetical protein
MAQLARSCHTEVLRVTKAVGCYGAVWARHELALRADGHVLERHVRRYRHGVERTGWRHAAGFPRYRGGEEGARSFRLDVESYGYA